MTISELKHSDFRLSLFIVKNVQQSVHTFLPKIIAVQVYVPQTRRSLNKQLFDKLDVVRRNVAVDQGKIFKIWQV